MSRRKIKVCILLEGSYPFITGGVSAWVHDLIQSLPEIEFSLFTISPEKDQQLRYTLPSNVTEHIDIVLTETKKSVKKIKNKKELFKQIKMIHSKLSDKTVPDIENLFKQMPEGYFLYSDAVTSEPGWELITGKNQKKNPLYPFSDYFWAWKSAHDMLFTTIGSTPPDADIYHSVSTGFAGIAALAAKSRRKKPFLLTEHGLYHKEREMEIRKTKYIRGYQRDMWVNIYNSISRLCYKNADRTTALFEENRLKQLELGAPADKTFVIPNGIDIERFSIKRKPRKGFHVGLIGRVVPIKDIKTYIATAKLVLDKIPDACFYCIGPTDEDPEYYKDCKLLVNSLRITDHFIFTGRQDVLNYYCFLDAVLLTSMREAQPLVIIEAYCAGIPVAATNVGNIAEMLDYNKELLAPSKDAVKLAEAIQYIHDNPEEIKLLTEKNLKKAHDFYDKKDLHRKFLEIYREMAGN